MLYRFLVLSDKIGCILSHRCTEMLRSLSQQSLKFEDLCLFYDAPLGITENIEFMNSVSNIIMKEVGDFESVLNIESLLKRFIKISPEALKSILSWKHIHTDSEDTILLVVHL